MTVAPLIDNKSLITPVIGSDNLKYTPRPAIFADVPDEKWNDWRWQMANRINSIEQLEQIIDLTDEERQGLQAEGLFRADITPYFAGLLEVDDPYGPVRQQVIPKGAEAVAFDAMMADSLNEDAHSPVPGLVHRYPDRVLMLITTQCATYCRYCTRSRVVGDSSANYTRADHDRQIAYIRDNPDVRDVLLSGGDPLVVAPAILEDLLKRLSEIPHLELIRIGSRVPIFLPQRVTDELCDMLRKYHPLWLNVHVNHPREITPELSRALAKLADAGIPLGNQSVLLRGVNDHPEVQMELVHKLVKNRVRPYYLYQCDLVQGAGHFRTPVSVGIEIIEALRGHTSGFAVPTYVVDAPGGGGKIPVMPEYVVSSGPNRVVLRNYEGFITTYAEPDAPYTRDDAQMLRYLERPARDEGVQEGVSGLASGQHMTIKPEGFEEAHQRGRQDEIEKRGKRNFMDDYS
ncbi:MAG: lysine 2,3-aminomutase [Anaerolineae bacterium]|nr:lysine 2,3-aminomutase [Anaerolineae bacterium]